MPTCDLHSSRWVSSSRPTGVRFPDNFAPDMKLTTSTDPVNGSWMALNTDTSGERSITMAVLIMSANTSGIVGSQIFQQEDRPLYRTGWSIILALATFALMMSVVANLQYRALNRRGKTKQDGAKFSL
jgi:hypothetical protein